MTQNDFRIEVYDIQVKILSQHGNGDDFWHQPLRTSPHSLALLVALAKKTQSLFHQWLKNYLGCWWNLSSLRMICRMWKVGTIFALPCSCVYSIWNLHVKTKSSCIFNSSHLKKYCLDKVTKMDTFQSSKYFDSKQLFGKLLFNYSNTKHIVLITKIQNLRTAYSQKLPIIFCLYLWLDFRKHALT